MTIKFNSNSNFVLRLFLLPLFLIFILSGINKITNFRKTSDTIKDKIPFLSKISNIITILVIITIILLPSIILIKPTNSLISQICSILLIIFMILVIIFFHNPITMKNQEINFMVRLSIIGGLLLVLYISQ